MNISSQPTPRQPGPISAWQILYLFICLCLLVTSVTLGFLQPMASDTSVYLLQTRTLMESGNRYIASHDNKGPMMVWLTAPAAALFGANIFTAGLIRAISAFATATLVILSIRSTQPLRLLHGAGIFTLAVCLPYAPILWGDSLRPETYSIPITAMLFYLLLRPGSDRRLFLVGMLITILFFLKSILIIPAGFICLSFLILEITQTKRFSARNVLLPAAGGLIATALVLFCLYSIDSIEGWFRQTIEWPAEYRQELLDIRSIFSNSDSFLSACLALYKASDDPTNIWLFPAKILLSLARTSILFIYAYALFLLFRTQKLRSRAIWLGLAWLLGVTFELWLEHRRWGYPPAGLLPPALFLAGSLTISGSLKKQAGIWLACSIMLLSLVAGSYETIGARFKNMPLSAYEEAQQQIQPHYSPGDPVMVLDNNYSLLLALDAPTPFPILPVHAALVSMEEQNTLISELQTHPPVWLAAKHPSYTGLHFGGTNQVITVQNRDGELFLYGPYETLIETTNFWIRKLKVPYKTGINPDSGSEN